jgi:hypothetical protein
VTFYHDSVTKKYFILAKHLREWLFYSQTGVGVRNYLGVGVGTGVGSNNLLGVDSGVDFYCLNFCISLGLKHLYEKNITILNIFVQKPVDKD